MEKVKYNHLFKVLLAGAAGTGKTAIIQQFADGTFTESYMTTIGVDFRMKTINCDDLKIKFQLWDTAGAQRFQCITQPYYRGSQIIFFVYDITSRSSFDHVRSSYESTSSLIDKNAIACIIGTKNDLEERREVLAKEAEELAKEIGVEFVGEISSTESSIQFETILSKLVKKLIP